MVDVETSQWVDLIIWAEMDNQDKVPCWVLNWCMYIPYRKLNQVYILLTPPLLQCDDAIIWIEK